MKNLFLVFAILFVVASCGGEDDVVPTPNHPTKKKVRIGTPALAGMSYSWYPTDSLDNPLVAQPMASPTKTTVYTVTATSKCGSASSQMTVRVYKTSPDGELVEQL